MPPAQTPLKLETDNSSHPHPDVYLPSESEEKRLDDTIYVNTAPSTPSLTSGSPNASARPDHEITLFTNTEIILVGWDDTPDQPDPENPLNWKSLIKWSNILIISVISFLVPLVSSMLAPAVPRVMADLNTTSKSFATFSVSIFVLGFASGPLILAPLSELYGRVIVYNITNVLFMTFTMLCGFSQNQGMFLGFRYLSGFAGVATITIGSGTIADLMPREERGRAVSIWAVGTILGPAIGPIIGGWVTEVAGWRWMFWGVSVAIGLVTLLAFLILKETYPPVLLERKALRLRKSTSNPHYQSTLAASRAKTTFAQNILRPCKLLLLCPTVTIMCAYGAIPYATLYLLFATYSFVFTQVYGFSTFANGLVFLAGGIGTLFGLAYIGYFSDKIIKGRMAAGKPVTPEDRLSLIITLPGSLTLPVGLFLYGWSAQRQMHWVVPQIGTAITGFGSIVVCTAVQTYLIDAFEGYAASVIGANTVLRCTAGALIPLGGLGLYEALGWGWGNSLLAFVALVFAPLPWVFGIYGGRIRGWGFMGRV